MKKFVLIAIFSVVYLSSFAQSNYQVVSTGKDNRGKVNQLSVYVKTITDVKKVNGDLWNKYKSTGVSSFQIFYYDNKKIAQTYSQLLFNGKISDDQIDKISKHVVGKFEYILGKGSLFVGEDALLN